MKLYKYHCGNCGKELNSEGDPCFGCYPTTKEEKQMGGEWFEWNENEWVNVTKSMRLKAEDMSDCVFKVHENLDWRVQGEKGYGFYFIRDFNTKQEALAFARDFMAKNGGIIE